jgi:hypothetical protein
MGVCAMSPYDDYAVLVLCAGDVDQIWRNLPGDKSGPPALPAAADPTIAYVNHRYFAAAVAQRLLPK